MASRFVWGKEDLVEHKTPRFVIGVDPGSKTGVALVRLAGGPGVVTAATVEPAIAGPLVLGLAILRGAPVVVELPPRQVYPRKGQNARAMTKISANVGQNRERVLALVRLLEEQGVDVHALPPVPKGTKWDASTFAAAFGKPKMKMSSHVRDAAVLAFVRGKEL